jgi:hypothetical protein
MREGKPELYFLLILYQKFFDLSNPNFGNIPICGGLPFGQTRLEGRYVAAFSGKSRYGERPLDAQEKLRIALRCGKSVRGVRPRPAENPHLLVYHIQAYLSIPKRKKKREPIRLSYKNNNLRSSCSRPHRPWFPARCAYTLHSSTSFPFWARVGSASEPEKRQSVQRCSFVKILLVIIFARGGPVGVCDTGPINPAIAFSALHFFLLLSASYSPQKGRGIHFEA